MPIIEALKNIPGSLIGRSSRLERGERAEVTEDQAHHLAWIGYAEQVGGEVDATPAAEELAQEEDVDLSDVEGTGKGGRILKSDVQDVI